VRIIVDTNIFVSGLISRKGTPTKIIEAILEGTLIPVMSQATFAELQEVLHRPRLQIYFQRAGITPESFLSQLKSIVEWVEVKPTELQIRDPKDQPFVDLATTSPSPAFIVTGDKDFEQQRYGEVPVISATLLVKTFLNKGE